MIPKSTAATERLRFGLLGTARIAPTALIEPAKRHDVGVDVVAVAARDPERARAFTGEATYTYQLRAFRDAVHGGPALPVQGGGAVANMTLIDAVRAAAGAAATPAI